MGSDCGETVHLSEMDAESGALCRRFLRPDQAARRHHRYYCLSRSSKKKTFMNRVRLELTPGIPDQELMSRSNLNLAP